MSPAPAAKLTWQAHDLLWIDDESGLQFTEQACPDWHLHSPLNRWAVVRRAPAAAGWVAVGLRGIARHQRCAAHLVLSAIGQGVSPEQLAAAAAWQHWPSSPITQALNQIAPDLNTAGLIWGPTGSVGFALASGLHTVRPESDIDLLIRLPQPPNPVQLAALHSLAHTRPCRLDVQIDTGHGGFALAEWLAGRGRILLKTSHGPQLLSQPWPETGN